MILTPIENHSIIGGNQNAYRLYPPNREGSPWDVLPRLYQTQFSSRFYSVLDFIFIANKLDGWDAESAIGIEKFKRYFWSIGKVPKRQRGGSTTPISGLNMRGAGCEKGLPGLCAQDIPKESDAGAGHRWVKTKGECWAH